MCGTRIATRSDKKYAAQTKHLASSKRFLLKKLPLRLDLKVDGGPLL
jgi:hypothetical protein